MKLIGAAAKLEAAKGSRVYMLLYRYPTTSREVNGGQGEGEHVPFIWGTGGG